MYAQTHFHNLFSHPSTELHFIYNLDRLYQEMIRSLAAWIHTLKELFNMLILCIFILLLMLLRLLLSLLLHIMVLFMIKFCLVSLF